jgi:hypothetical protein
MASQKAAIDVSMENLFYLVIDVKLVERTGAGGWHG